ncbi:hypothetical protein PZA11_000292 [Diplocarpon coronariae]|uniref:Carbon catabolite repression protein CreD n=1 Tax=Diplocarpon coronariae TaxID=2795749 RepID=A0A218Z248_9HELO|nr:carbon catabolite repression protein CreD [Marssonina coronariae]
MPSFFGGVTGRYSATLFEIRLDNDIIVLRGGESEASSQMLKGVVVLCLPTSLKLENVHLRMTGQLKVGWNDPRPTPGGAPNKVDKTSEIFCYRWAPFVGATSGSNSRGTNLPMGNYEWPFELVIAGNMAESLEGLQDSHIQYKLKATVARGKLAYDLHTYKAVRIVRTLDPSALELAHAMTVENVWANKIEYQILIPQKAVIFGTAIDVEMKFTSLLKGLEIGKIKCQLIEVHEFSIPATQHTEKSYKNEKDINTWTYELKEEDYTEFLDPDGQDGWILREKMPLPKSLKSCVQDMDVHGIKIRHKVKFNIALNNPDGHVSELRATLPVTIFISPNMPLSADGQLVDQTPLSAQSTDTAQHAPPLYGQHVLDQLYADMNNAGIMTPAPQSGMNTPFYGLSRAGSTENLASLGGVANQNGAVPPAALSSRLQNLDLNASSRNNSSRRLLESGYNTPSAQRLRDSEPGYSESNSNPLSRRTSEDGHARSAGIASGQRTPDEHLDFAELGDLTKVPSYQTAVKAPARSMSYSNTLPDYSTAVLAPPSPERERRNPLSSMGFTPINPLAPTAAADGAGDYRLPTQLFQNRGRH